MVAAAACKLFNAVFSPGAAIPLKDKHVLITGGSSGIGLAVAQEVVAAGGRVTLVGRSAAKLEAARGQLQAKGAGRRVAVRPCDVTAPGVAEVVAAAEQDLGPITLLVNCAGYSIPARLEDLSLDDVKNMMNVNFIGTFAVTQAVVKAMRAQPSEPGQRRGVVLCSSQGGLLGICGFTGYAASKAALVKFGEALHMETAPDGISVTVCVPPDTDTPGFETENKTKPEETRLVSESAGLFTAEAVARQLLADACGGRFYSTVGIEGFMLVTLSAGMGPLTCLWDYLTQVLLMGVFRAISVLFLANFQRIVRRQHAARQAQKKRE